MEKPEFPKGWLDHCPQVKDAEHWHRRIAPQTIFHKEDYAECAFIKAGCGMECEVCEKFMTRPYNGVKLDETWLPQIEKYYEELEAYEKWLESNQKRPVVATPESKVEEKHFSDSEIEFIKSSLNQKASNPEFKSLATKLMKKLRRVNDLRTV